MDRDCERIFFIKDQLVKLLDFKELEEARPRFISNLSRVQALLRVKLKKGFHARLLYYYSIPMYIYVDNYHESKYPKAGKSKNITKLTMEQKHEFYSRALKWDNEYAERVNIGQRSKMAKYKQVSGWEFRCFNALTRESKKVKFEAT